MPVRVVPRAGARPRILILSASSGAGHVRAGQALARAFAARNDCEVEHFDALDYTSRLFRRIYNDAYIAMVRRAPGFVGWLYDRLDKPWRHPRRRLAFDRLNALPMARLLKRVAPEIVVATHFMPAEIAAWMKSKGKLDALLATVVTDFDVHAMWLVRGVDRWFVALDEAAEYLVRLGVAAESIEVTGIPIDPEFAVPRDRRALRRSLGLDAERIVVLVTAGGYGVGPIERIVSDLVALGRPWQIVAVAGRSETIRKRLEKIAAADSGSRGRARALRVLGFTEQMHLWMAAADLLVGKAGGLTVSEALACRLPMVLVGPLPGQEERNAEHLVERSAAIRCQNLPVTAWKIARLLDDPLRLDAMRKAARALAHPDAAQRIAARCIESLGGAPRLL